jgi:hypothetical protein
MKAADARRALLRKSFSAAASTRAIPRNQAILLSRVKRHR